MKYGHYSLILLLFTQVSFAFTDPSGSLCRKISRDYDDADVCAKLGARTHVNRNVFDSNCSYAVRAFRENPETAMAICLSSMKAATANADDTETDYLAPTGGSNIGSSNGGYVEQELPPPRISNAMNNCQEKSSDDYVCKVDSPIVMPGLDEMIRNLVPSVAMSKEPKYTADTCKCFNDASKKTIQAKGPVQFEADIQKEKYKINDLIFKAAGVKILNSFAANLEDVNFFRSNVTAHLGGDESAKKLQCNDVSQYRIKVLAACNANKVNAVNMEERMSKILGALGDTTQEATVEQKFAKLEDEILNIKLEPGKIGRGRSSTLNRVEFDKMRFGAAKVRPSVSFINDITDAAIHDPALSQEIHNAIMVENKTPGHAIFKLLKDESRPEVKALLLKLVNSKKDNRFYKDLKGVIDSPNPDDLGVFINDQVNAASDLHPGLKAIFKDKDLFAKVRAATQRKDRNSMLSVMAQNPEFLTEHFSERCDSIQNEFAEAVCVADDDFVKRTDPEDLNRLLSVFDDQINPNLKDLILCRIPKSDGVPSVFHKLSFNKWDKPNQSDYWEMRTRKEGQSSQTLLSHVRSAIEKGDRKASKYFSQLAEMGEAFRSPDREYVAAVEKTESLVFSEPVKVRESEAFKDVAIGLNNLSEGFSKIDPNARNANFVDYSLPAAIPAGTENSAARTTRSERSNRALLKEFLADEENAAEVERHLSQTKDEDHRELLRLREELAKNQTTIAGLANQTEKNKLKALQEEFKALENQSSGMASTANQDDNDSRSIAPVSNALSQVTPEISGITNSFVGNAQTSGSSGGAGNSVTRGPASVAAANIASGSADGNFAISSSSPSSQGEIVIEPSNAGIIVGQQIAPEDLSQVIKSYVEQTELDLQGLKRLRDQEVVIRYKVVENGVEIMKVMRVKSDTLSSETKKFLGDQIALREQLGADAKRAHSFATLKLLLGIKNRATN